jgi:hypothetical protein
MHVPAPQAWLQEFAWTEDDKAAKQARRRACRECGGRLARQPMFCFEQAARCLYWSTLAYDYLEVRPWLQRCSLHFSPWLIGLKDIEDSIGLRHVQQ